MSRKSKSALPLTLIARTSSAVTRCGSASGTRVWMRSTLTWSIFAQRLHYRAQAPRRQHQRIAAGEDHLPDFAMRANVIKRAAQTPPPTAACFCRSQPFRGENRSGNRPRISGRELEQHPVGIAMHDAFERTVRVVADRVGQFVRPHIKFGSVRHELARDRIVRIVTDRSARRAPAAAPWRSARRPLRER